MTAPTAPPTWATSLAEWRCGLRWLLRSLVEEEAGHPLPALPKLLHMIPDDERQLVLADLRMADHGSDGGDDAGDRLDAAIDRAVWVWETYAAAAYQHGPHMGRLDVPTPDVPAPAVGRCPTCDSPQPSMHPAVQEGGEVAVICPDPFHSDALTAAARDNGLFGAAANRATAAANRAATDQEARMDELATLLNAETADEITGGE
jgi:hypothetical protein